jgi:pimeloyl-ACP methyl ester carboxylesterase
VVGALSADGRQDVISPVEHGRYLAEHIPVARLVEFEGADHWAVGT